MAQATEGADHLVHDEEGAVLVAQAPEPLQVAGQRRADAAGALHGLGDHRGDLVAPLGEEGGHGLEVVVGQVDEVGQQRPEAGLVGGQALGASARRR